MPGLLMYFRQTDASNRGKLMVKVTPRSVSFRVNKKIGSQPACIGWLLILCGRFFYEACVFRARAVLDGRAAALQGDIAAGPRGNLFVRLKKSEPYP
jgi:hypothetical protein